MMDSQGDTGAVSEVLLCQAGEPASAEEDSITSFY